MITAAMVKKLREKTGAGMMNCKQALEKAEGNEEKAIEFLREKGLAAADKKVDRIATEGLIDSYIHLGGRVGVLIEVNCETDFVARNEDFKRFVRDICLQIAATNPAYLSREQVDQEVVDKEKDLLRRQAANEGKPDKVVDMIVNGRIEKFYKENCLLEQSFVKDPDKTVAQLQKEMIALIGENISIRRYVRFEVGEGLEKKKECFADEVKEIASSK